MEDADQTQPIPPNSIPAVEEEPAGRVQHLSEQEVEELQTRMRETGRRLSPQQASDAVRSKDSR
jgi:hypothetical protein